MAALAARVTEATADVGREKTDSSRRSQIGHMGRGSRVRTYNLFRGFVKDERTGGKYRPDKIIGGELNLI